MEKQMRNNNTGIRSTFSRLFIASALVAGSFLTGQAQDTNAKPAVGADIRYAGTANDKIFFEVSYKNAGQQPFSVEIRDGEGYVFYTGRFKEKEFRKYFAIDKSEILKASISIAVAAKDAIQRQVFDVTATSHTIDEVNVVKL